MAVSRVKTWVAGEVLTAADLNAEFDNQNQTNTAFPLTNNVSAAGFTISNAVLATTKQLNDNVVCMDNYADFATAISSIGSTRTTLLINANVNVTASATVPSTLTLWFMGQGKLTISASQVVTINGPLVAPPFQIFAGSGTVAFTSNNSLLYILPQWWGAVGDGVTDDTTAINNTIAAAGDGRTVLFPDGDYKTTAFLNAEDYSGLTLKGSGGHVSGSGGSRILGVHTGKAILSLVGSSSVRVIDLILDGDGTSKPKTGLLLGRSSAASAGNHRIQGLRVTGSFTVAPIYNVASEANVWIDPVVSVSAAPIACWYMSDTDTQSIGGLTSSTMTQETILGGFLLSTDTTAGSTVVWIDGTTDATGHLYFYGTFLSKKGGDSFVTINIDTTLTRPIIFQDAVGESNGGTRPTSGVHITGTAGAHLQGLIADPITLDAETNAFKSDTNVGQLTNSRIRWTPVRDGLIMDLNAGYGSDFYFMNNGVMNFPNGLYASRLIYNYASGPTIGTAATGSHSALVTGAPLNERGTATFVTAATVAVSFSVNEPSATYYVSISGGANETYWVTSKATTGFTINSSNASSTATVDWVLTR